MVDEVLLELEHALTATAAMTATAARPARPRLAAVRVCIYVVLSEWGCGLSCSVRDVLILPALLSQSGGDY